MPQKLFLTVQPQLSLLSLWIPWGLNEPEKTFLPFWVFCFVLIVFPGPWNLDYIEVIKVIIFLNHGPPCFILLFVYLSALVCQTPCSMHEDSFYSFLTIKKFDKYFLNKCEVSSLYVGSQAEFGTIG